MPVRYSGIFTYNLATCSNLFFSGPMCGMLTSVMWCLADIFVLHRIGMSLYEAFIIMYYIQDIL